MLQYLCCAWIWILFLEVWALYFAIGIPDFHCRKRWYCAGWIKVHGDLGKPRNFIPVVLKVDGQGPWKEGFCCTEWIERFMETLENPGSLFQLFPNLTVRGLEKKYCAEWTEVHGGLGKLRIFIPVVPGFWWWPVETEILCRGTGGSWRPWKIQDIYSQLFLGCDESP